MEEIKTFVITADPPRVFSPAPQSHRPSFVSSPAILMQLTSPSVRQMYSVIMIDGFCYEIFKYAC